MASTNRPLASVPEASEPVPSPVLLFTVEEAAAALTIGKTKFYELLKSGDLSARYIGRRRVIAAADLRRYIDALPTEPAA